VAAASKLAGDAPAGASELGFANRKLLEREEDEGNASPASEWPKRSPRKAFDGAAIDGTFGARGNKPREHCNAREKAEEGEEDEARSPTRRRRTKTARNGGLRAEVAASRRRFSMSAQERDRGEKRGKWGGEEGTRLSAHFLSKGGEGRTWERTSAWQFSRERGNRVAVWGRG